MDILVPDTKIQTARSLEEASARAASPITFSAVEASDDVLCDSVFAAPVCLW